MYNSKYFRSREIVTKTRFHQKRRKKKKKSRTILGHHAFSFNFVDKTMNFNMQKR